MKTAYAAAALAVVFGCGGSEAGLTPVTAPTPVVATSPLVAPTAQFPLAVAATQGTALGPDFGVAGQGASRIGAFSLAHGSGEIELDGRSVPVATYVKSDGFPGIVIYQGLAVEPGRIWVLFFYCNAATQALSDVYYETTDGTPGTFEGAFGTCSDGGVTLVQPQFPTVSLPALNLLPGYAIHGPDIELDGAQPGAIRLRAGSGVQDLLAFNIVDCSTCASAGWIELHTLLWDASSGSLTFAIVYLVSDDPDHVQIWYQLRLPDLGEPPGGFMSATWSAPPASALGGAVLARPSARLAHPPPRG